MIIDDQHIIRLLLSGVGKDEQEAFRLLVAKYSERLYWHVRKIVIGHEDADDVLQNTYIKVWKGIREFRHESRLYTWMYRVATNEALNFLQERRRGVHGNSEEISGALENQLEGDPYFSGDEIQRELQKAVLKLPERQRLVFNMKYFDDMKYEEIAGVLGVAVGTLKATYHAAVKKVEESLRLSDVITI
jgi:RNA polymerase sigma-70 factor (ECF subfamily)